MSAHSSLRFVIVGGVAAGASAAARARRLDESATITLIERGPDVSFANCGLPYFIGGEIKSRDALAVQTPQTLKALLALEVRTSTEAVAIDREGKRVQLRHLAAGTTEWLPYDRLLLAPGAVPLRPPLPGLDDPRIFTLRSLQDMDRIKAAASAAQRVAIIGAGFIGLEMAEQFVRLQKSVTLIELQDQVLPPLDRPMTRLLEDELRRHGVDLMLGESVERFTADTPALTCHLRSGRSLTADLVVLSIGVRPDNALARDAGLLLGGRGHIRTNGFMQTSDPSIYAAGDVAEVEDFVTGEPTAVPLGGPANRQGRLVADHIFRPTEAKPFPGVLGTAIVRAFDVAAGLTGWTEKRLRAAGRAFRTVTVNDNHHAGYFPGAKGLLLKLLWDPASGRVLGAEVTGFAGVDKRLDVLATAITGGLTIDDVAQLELGYAPPFGSAKDIVNLAGFAACNTRDGLVTPVDALPDDSAVQILDVRPPALVQAHPLPRPGAINIPLGAWLGRRFSVGTKIATLISAGTGICGGSAIAAIAPAINASLAETSASLATVFLLNGVALIVFPPLGTWFGLDAHAFGLWCALAIHDTSSVTGAAMTHGPEALATATTVKLARALWIVPVALALGAWFARRADGATARQPVRMPWFIGGFILLSALFTVFPQWHPVAHDVSLISRALLTLTLFFIGAGLDRRAVHTVGLRPFVLGLLLWILVGAATLGAILAGWIR